MPVLHIEKPRKILIAPLDWGLGHATRCIPIIRELLTAGCEVFIASEKGQAALLKAEFPEVKQLLLPGYHMRYSKNGKTFGLKMLTQLPRLQRAILREHQWLQETVPTLQPDAIISDNRYGLYHPQVPSVIMTHQLRIAAPFPGKPEDWLQKVNYRLLGKFSACWIVDFEGEDNLAGELSHPALLPPVPVQYLGALSRFEKKDGRPPELDLLVLISGPEPQRSKFEQLIRRQITPLPIRALLLSGQPDKPKAELLAPNIKMVNHLSTAQLEDALLKSRLVVCRPGYTTVMDLVKLQKKAILIPTPGQTEQEYLAAYLQRKSHCLTYAQKDFALSASLEKAKTFAFKPVGLPEMDQYKKVVKAFLAGL